MVVRHTLDVRHMPLSCLNKTTVRYMTQHYTEANILTYS